MRNVAVDQRAGREHEELEDDRDAGDDRQARVAPDGVPGAREDAVQPVRIFVDAIEEAIRSREIYRDGASRRDDNRLCCGVHRSAH